MISAGSPRMRERTADSALPSAVIAHPPLAGNTSSPDVAALLDAVEVLCQLNATGRTIVPDEATTEGATSFVPARWRGYLESTHGQGRGTAYRHYLELSVLCGVPGCAPATCGARLAPLHRPDHAVHPRRDLGHAARRLLDRHRSQRRSGTAAATAGDGTARRRRGSGATARRRGGPGPGSHR